MCVQGTGCGTSVPKLCTDSFKPGTDIPGGLVQGTCRRRPVFVVGRGRELGKRGLRNCRLRLEIVRTVSFAALAGC